MSGLSLRKAYADCTGGQIHYRYLRGPATGGGAPLVLFQQTTSRRTT